jgi:hypothetical protein
LSVLSDQPLAKGVMFRTVLRLTEERLGPAGLAKVIDALPADLAEGVRYGRIVPSGWYSVIWFRALLAATGEVSGEHLPFIRDLGRKGLRVEYGSVYRALMRLLSPESLLETGLSHFAQVYSRGKVEPIEFREGYARVRWYECKDFDSHVWQYLIGACIGMIELTGGKSIQARILKGGEADELEAIARWQ